jgi:hypothetical protein
MMSCERPTSKPVPRTEAKKEFIKAAEETLKTLKAFVEGIDDVEHAKWTPEQKRTACHRRSSCGTS